MSNGSVNGRKYETTIQMIRHEVFYQVAKMAMEGSLQAHREFIPVIVFQGNKARFRCCVYKERAVAAERVRLACGEAPQSGVAYEAAESGIPDPLVRVIAIACDECPVDRFTVTGACRGCITHRCIEACPVDAIAQINRLAYINQQKCIECGRCHQVCPYGAITDMQRPCIKACPVKAIQYGEDKIARIDPNKCVSCGHCAVSCPFGAISDLSYIPQAVEMLKTQDGTVHAVLAPSVASQFPGISIGQVHHALKKLGFAAVHEAALGADMIVDHEAKELAEKLKEGSFLTNSCCPAFVSLIEKHFPTLKGNISTSVSPMVAVGRYVKKLHPEAKTVFIGPCYAKKVEIGLPKCKGHIDLALTFEEIFAMFDAAGISLADCPDEPLQQASPFGRRFARCGGVSEAIAQALKEAGVQVELKPVQVDGLDACIKVLRQAKVGRPPGNFIEGMACVGGCVGGPASLNHTRKARQIIDTYSEETKAKTITEALSAIETP
ncbi:ferridoxin/ hydrogenase, putative [Heliomicrobium modesticaldum Ice1]|uniref:Ferridoxin/ hydrogenase, putative n=1 Tax=Heliobacterium modesticaldum (strain ATCC 51547 / Ice1) TaxID=498761 RepID=B0TDE6_HELMI|nr:4Fe-4S dicluster domain-containing protein [Heliomicrobium modesticaldum]ABZ84187.1 ferridoxin/ hydrogenase, putative [Heliomicrobium modesticaldum Ice1]